MKSHLELRRLNPASNRSARRSRRLPSALVAAALLAVPSAVRAQTWNDVTGNWSVAGNWTPSGVPAGADNVSNTTSLVFGGANAYTSTLNVGAASSTFGVNALTFNNSSAAGVTLTLADGRTLTFAGTVANPSITQNGSAPVAINGTLLLRDNVGPSGANGTTNFLGAGAGDLSITEVRFNVNNSPVLQLDGDRKSVV